MKPKSWFTSFNVSTGVQARAMKADNEEQRGYIVAIRPSEHLLSSVSISKANLASAHIICLFKVTCKK